MSEEATHGPNELPGGRSFPDGSRLCDDLSRRYLAEPEHDRVVPEFLRCGSASRHVDRLQCDAVVGADLDVVLLALNRSR
jgi:hypothetical protein